jgi:hypothetical protein
MAVSIRGALSSVAVTLALAGCSSTDLMTAYLPGACPDSGGRLAGVEWDRARVVSIDVRQGNFDPIVIRVRRDDPYIFRFTNRDDFTRTFRSAGFFTSIAVEKINIGTEERIHPCVSSVDIPPNVPVEIYFVPVRDGRYEFEDPTLGIPLVFGGGANGVIYIALPRATIESPTNFRVIDPPPPPPSPAGSVAPPAAARTPAPGGFPIDPSLQSPAPNVTGSPLPGDAPGALPGDVPATLPGDAPDSEGPITLPGDPTLSLPGDPPPFSAEPPIRLPGDPPAQESLAQ